MNSARLLVLFALVSAVAAPVMARTIELTDNDADLVAVIGPEAPRMSWAAFESGPAFFSSDQVALRPRAAMLIRVPLDRIPAGSRITKAEWTLTTNWMSVPEAKLYVWRILEDWGAGVCHQYRTMRPKPVEWTSPGASGSGTDRAGEPSIVVTARPNSTVVLNVTEDVELWHSGAVPNRGWMFTVEEEVQLRLASPTYTRGSWKLRITYEPQ